MMDSFRGLAVRNGCAMVILAIIGQVLATTFVVPCCNTVDIQTALSNPSYDVVALTASMIYSGPCDLHFDHPGVTATLQGNGATIQCTSGTYGFIIDDPMSESTVLGPLSLQGPTIIAVNQQNGFGILSHLFISNMGGVLHQRGGEVYFANSVIVNINSNSQSGTVGDIVGGLVTFANITTRNTSRVADTPFGPFYPLFNVQDANITILNSFFDERVGQWMSAPPGSVVGFTVRNTTLELGGDEPVVYIRSCGEHLLSQLTVTLHSPSIYSQAQFQFQCDGANPVFQHVTLMSALPTTATLFYADAMTFSNSNFSIGGPLFNGNSVTIIDSSLVPTISFTWPVLDAFNVYLSGSVISNFNLFIRTTTLVAVHSTFTNNSGALNSIVFIQRQYAILALQMTLSGCTFRDNVMPLTLDENIKDALISDGDGDGYGVHLIVNCSFVNNTVMRLLNLHFAQTPTIISIVGTVFESNVAIRLVDIGPIALSYVSITSAQSAFLSGCRFANNRASKGVTLTSSQTSSATTNYCWAANYLCFDECTTYPTTLGQLTLVLFDVVVYGDVYSHPSPNVLAGFALVVDICVVYSRNSFDIGAINASKLHVANVNATSYVLKASFGTILDTVVVDTTAQAVSEVVALTMARVAIVGSTFSRVNHIAYQLFTQYDTCRETHQAVFLDAILIQRCRFSAAFNLGGRQGSVSLRNVTFDGNSPHPTETSFPCQSMYSSQNFEFPAQQPGGGVALAGCQFEPYSDPAAPIPLTSVRLTNNVADDAILAFTSQALLFDFEFVNNTVRGANSALILLPVLVYGTQGGFFVNFTSVSFFRSFLDGSLLRVGVDVANSYVNEVHLANVQIVETVFGQPMLSMSTVPVFFDNVTITDVPQWSPPVITGVSLGGLCGLYLRNIGNSSLVMNIDVPVAFKPLFIFNLVMSNITCTQAVVFTGQGLNMDGLIVVGVHGQALSVTSTRGMSLSNSMIADNSNGVDAVILISNAVNAAWTNATFVCNRGGIGERGYVHVTGTTTLVNWVVRENDGSITLPSSSTITGCTFLSNSGSRGAIMVHNSLIQAALFEWHMTGVGALNIGYYKGTVEVANSTFRNNICDGLGGAIFVAPQNRLQLQSVLFASNSAVEGGAVYISSGSTLAFGNVTAWDNTAENAGGAVRVVETSGAVRNSTFANNRVLNASDSAPGGGSLYAYLNFAALTFTGVIMRGNVAVHGGGARIDGAASFVNSTISDNSALFDGGGLYLGPKFRVGILEQKPGTLLVLSGNRAARGGGFYCSGCAMDLTLSSIQQNHADIDGSGLFCDPSYRELQRVNFGLVGSNVIDDNIGNGSQSVCGTCGCCQVPATVASLSEDCLIAPGFTCDFTCKRGYQRHGDADHEGLLYCDSGSRMLSTAACDPIPCLGSPAPIANGTFSLPSNAVTPNVTHYVCDAGFVPILRHDSSIIPTAAIMCVGPNWEVEESDLICQLVTCSTASAFPPGSYTDCPEKLYYGSRCTGRCAAGYEGSNAFVECIRGGGNQTLGQLSQVDNRGLGCTHPCDNGFYREASEPTGTCQACGPHFLTLSTGSTSFADCGCMPSYFINGTVCSPCPAGADCAGFRAPPVSKPGYFPSNNTGGDKILYLECRPAIACAGNNSCALGYEGYLCGDCSPDFHRFSGKCLSCPAVNGWRVTLGIIGGLIACLLLMFATKPTQESERTVGFGSLTVGISFIQLVATFATINVAWPKSSSNMYDTFSTANLNVEIVNPECSVKANFYDKFQTTLLMPFAIFALFCLAWVIGSLFIWLKAKRPKLAAIRLRLEQLAEAALSGFYFFLSLAYLLLARASFSIFACPRQADGRRTLTDNPAEECSGPVWSRNAVFGVFGIIVYVFGSPFLLHISYHLVNRKFGSRVAGNTYISNFLVKAYRPKFWFWEVVSMARKLAIVIIALYAVQDPTIQVVLSCAVFFVSAVLTLVFKPFEWPKHNFIEVVTQLGCIIVLFCGAVAANRNVDNKLSATESTALDVVIITTTVLVIICVVVCFLFEVGITVYIGKVFKKLYPKKPPPHVTVADTSQQVAFICDNNHAVLSVAADGSICHRNETTLVSQADYPVSGLLSPVTHAAAMGDFVVLAAGNQLTVQHTTGVEVWSIKELPANVTSLASNQYGLALGLADGHVMLWRKSSSIIQTPVVPMSGVEAMEEIKASKDVTQEGLVGYQALKPLEVASGWVIGVAFELDFVYTLDARFVKKWNAQSGVCLRKWEMLELPDVTCLAVKGSSIAVGGGNGRVVLILEEGDSREVLAGHRAAISSLAIAKDYIISGSLDGKINCWDLNTGRYRQCMPDNSDRVTLVATDPTGSRVFWALRSGEIHSYPLHADWDRVNVEFLLWKSQKQNCKRCKIPRVLFGGEGFDRDGDVLQSFTTASDGSKPGVYDELELLVQGTKWDELDIEDANHIASLLGNAVDRSKVKRDTQL